MNNLLSLNNAGNRIQGTQTNMERLDESLAFDLRPTKIGVPLAPNTLVGPPVAGEWYQHKLWVDSLGSIWRCTVAGTPGTWLQIIEAVVADSTARDAIVAPPNGYRALTADTGERFIWDGAAWDAI